MQNSIPVKSGIVATAPFRFCKRTEKVFGTSEIPGGGDTSVCDIRGWGHLTGGGQAHHMSSPEAIVVTHATGELIAKLLNDHFARFTLVEDGDD